MAKSAIGEVEVLRFFETEPLDKATVLFNIVADKMQASLHGNQADARRSPDDAVRGRRKHPSQTRRRSPLLSNFGTRDAV